MMKAEVVETLLYGRVTQSPNKSNHDKLRQVHESTLRRYLGSRKRKHEGRNLFYGDALVKTVFESISIEAMMRTRRITCTGFVSWHVPGMGEERLPKGVVFWELAGVDMGT